MNEIKYKMPENPNIHKVNNFKDNDCDNNYNNINLNFELRKYLIRELMRLSGKLYIHQAENMIDKFEDKLGLIDKVIIHKGIEWCSNEILNMFKSENKENYNYEI